MFGIKVFGLKKQIFFPVALFLLLSGSGALANTVTINDTLSGPLTYAIEYRGDDPRGGSLSTNDYADVIGTDIFRTDSAQVTFDASASKLTLVFQTNFPANGTTVSGHFVYPADVFLNIDSNPSWDIGIVTYAHDGYSVGSVIANPSFQTSQDIWQGRTNFYYGGRYTTADPAELNQGEAIPVKINGDDTIGTASVNWNESTGTLAYDLTIVLLGNLFPDVSSLDFIWGTGDCGNDAIYGQAAVHTPLPGTVLLLGTGLFGVGLLGWRRKNARG